MMETKLDVFNPETLTDELLELTDEYRAMSLRVESAYADIDNYFNGTLTAVELEYKYSDSLRVEDGFDTVITGTVKFGEKIIYRIIDFIASIVIDMIKIAKKSWLKYVSGKNSLSTLAKKINDVKSLPSSYVVDEDTMSNFYFDKIDLSVSDCFKAIVLDSEYPAKLLDILYDHTKKMGAVTPDDVIIDETPDDAVGTFKHDQLTAFRTTVKTSVADMVGSEQFILKPYASVIDDRVTVPILVDKDGSATCLAFDEEYGRVYRTYISPLKKSTGTDVINLAEVVKSVVDLDMKKIVKEDIKLVEKLEVNISKYLKDARNHSKIGRHGAKTIMTNCNTMTNIVYSIGMYRLKELTRFLILARDTEKK